MQPTVKPCTKCGIPKPPEEFYRRGKGLTSWCKECTKAKNAPQASAWYERNRKKQKAAVSERRASQPRSVWLVIALDDHVEAAFPTQELAMQFASVFAPDASVVERPFYRAMPVAHTWSAVLDTLDGSVLAEPCPPTLPHISDPAGRFVRATGKTESHARRRLAAIVKSMAA